MSITAEYVSEIFKGLEEGDGASFFSYVDDNVDWIVEGTHPLAGHYHSKAAFIEGTFTKLGKVLPKGVQLHVKNILVSGTMPWWNLIPWQRQRTTFGSTTATAGCFISKARRSTWCARTWTQPW
jgi:ketosteroid isomerase-like protein